MKHLNLELEKLEQRIAPGMMSGLNNRGGDTATKKSSAPACLTIIRTRRLAGRA